MIKEGFNPETEKDFLRRLPERVRDVNLAQELKTQLAEDFGLVEFTLKYKFQDGLITDLNSGQGVVELVERGGIDEEIESIRKIQEGLKKNSERVWIHFSPKNDQLGYPENCVDFWRMVGKEVIWNRMVVKNGLKEMDRVRSILGGNIGCRNEMEILKSPISVEMKLSEIFSFFTLCENRYFDDFEYIEKAVDQRLGEFKKEFGDSLISSSDLIFRLYSACHKFLRTRGSESYIVNRGELEMFMYGEMRRMTTEKSFGCAGSTTVGEFGKGYIIVDGKVSFGIIPEGFRLCKKCGCYYEGDKCPLC